MLRFLWFPYPINTTLYLQFHAPKTKTFLLFTLFLYGFSCSCEFPVHRKGLPGVFAHYADQTLNFKLCRNKYKLTALQGIILALELFKTEQWLLIPYSIPKYLYASKLIQENLYNLWSQQNSNTFKQKTIPLSTCLL